MVTIDGDWLREHYIFEQESISTIAKHVGCSLGTVHLNLKKYGIPRRRPGWEWKRLNIDARWLEKMYVDKRYSTTKIAKMIGCSGRSISLYLKIYNIPARSVSESCRGELSSQWRGGISNQLYCPKFNNRLKEQIRTKFERRCFLCGSLENIKLSKQRHCIHHVDYNKNSICNGQTWPLLPLCNPCHTRTNYHRWYWFNLLINYWSENPDINLEGDNMYIPARVG